MAKRYPEITLSEEELIAEARKWELSHGGMSGRAAQQLIYDLSGKAMIQKWKDERSAEALLLLLFPLLQTIIKHTSFK